MSYLLIETEKQFEELLRKLYESIQIEKPTFYLNTDDKGKVDFNSDLETEDFLIEFEVRGRLKFFKESNAVFGNDPAKQIDIEPEIRICNISVKNEEGDLYEFDIAGYESRLAIIIEERMESEFLINN